MRRCATILLVCLLAGIELRAGDEYPAKPGEKVVANELIVRLVPGAAVDALIGRYLPGAQVHALGRDSTFRIRFPAGLPSGVSARIAADLQVDFVEPNRIRQTTVAAPNDPNYASSWWFQTVQALQAWSLLPGQYLTAATAASGRVKVAVIDTGADCTHPDFINTGGSSTDSAQGGQLMFSASQAVVATTISNAACPWQDDHGHGTHVTGIVAAATSNGLGVSGLGYPVQVIEYKVLDSTGSGNDVNIATAIQAAADAGAQVVSMSLGGAGYSQWLQNAVTYAWQHNTLVVAAAGNDAKNELFFPAGANHAVGVSATDSGNNLAYFSNFGNSVQLAAPGLGILSTAPSYPGTSQGWLNYVSLSGTSMATPFVSGLAGLVAMTTPNATAAAILQRMEQTASSLTAGGGWGQNFGYGIIDASNAVSGTSRTAANGAITGQIVNASGNPVNGAHITINSQTITTDTTGLYRFGTLPAGTYPVSVSATGYATQSLSAAVAPGADTSFTVTMGVTYGKFTGTVTDQGAGVAGAIVQALSGGLITALAIADQSGQYTLWVPGSGAYDVRASQIGRVTTTLSALNLPVGGTTSANLTLPRMGTIAGNVRDGNLNPIANAQVLVTGGPFSAAATTDGSGNYSLIGVPTGIQYSATATAIGFVASTQNGIAVSADAITNISFTMGSSTVATPTFAPPAGAYGSAQSVTIGTTTPGASIRYTTDGSTPSSTVGTVYSTPVSVSSSLTLRAIAYKSGMTDSAVASGNYTITIGGSNWYNPSWTNRKAITIDHTKVSETLTDFPMLFSVTDANLKTVANGGGAGKTDGTDLLFTASDGVTKLDHELESYNPATGKTVAWVRVPSLSATVDTTIYIYYGNAAAADQQNKTGVWDSNYRMVQHFGDGTTLNATDSTVNASNGTINGATAGAGQMAGAANMNGSNAWISVPNFPKASGGRTTVSAWVKANAAPVWASILKNWANGPGEFHLGLDSGSGRLSIYMSQSSGSTIGPVIGASSFSIGTWQHVAFVADGTAVHLYLNGAEIGTPAAYNGTLMTSLPCLGIGAKPNDSCTGADSGSPGFWNGLIDEARISSTNFSAGRIATDYNNQSSPGTFFATSGQESSGSASVVATPTFNPPAGAYGSAQSVIIGTTTGGASIRYTTDGSTPTSTVGTVYNGPVSVGSSLTLKAIAYGPGLTDSAVASGSYTITIQAATPTFAPPAGSYSSAQSVTIGTTTSGASIRYTTDGSTPSSTVGTLYSGPVSVTGNLTLKAIAYGSGMTDSQVASAVYTIAVATPTFAPPAGSYSSAQSVTIGTTTSGASIRYTTDGSTPSSTVGTLYSGPVSVTGNLTLKAIAYGPGLTDSAVASGSYTITIQAATPTFAPPAGSYSSAQSVTIGTTTSGASIRYTTDGSTPSSTVGTLYSGPVSVSSSLTLKAIAYGPGLTDSTVASGSYTITIQAATPTFAPPAGSYSSAQSVTIGTTTSGASIRYTTDGSTPSSTVGTPYSGPVSVGSSLTLKAIAYGPGLIDSLVATATYTISSGGGGPAWYNPSWTNRKAITIDHTKVSETLTDFPMLFSVTDANLKTVANGGGAGKADGSDLLFTASDGVTKLDHELESYNPATGKTVAWVRVPSLSATADTTIYIYYGNAAAGDQQNKTGVWDSNYKMVQHFGDGTTLNATDSTVNASNGTINGATAGAGQMGGAASLNGSNAWISVPNFPKASGGRTTVSAWVKANSAPVWASILKNWANGPGEFHLGLDSGSGRLSIYMSQSSGSTIGPVIGASSFSIGTWQHVAFVADGTAVHLYLNGAEIGTPAAYNGTLMTSLPCLGIGAKPNDSCTGADSGNPGFWNGLIDEARISSTNLSAGRIATDYNNQSSPGTFYTVGAQE